MPLRGRIAVGARLAGRLDQLLDDVLGRRQVGIAHAEIDDVGAAGAGRGLDPVDLLEDVGRQALDAVKVGRHRPCPRTGGLPDPPQPARDVGRSHRAACCRRSGEIAAAPIRSGSASVRRDQRPGARPVGGSIAAAAALLLRRAGRRRARPWRRSASGSRFAADGSRLRPRLAGDRAWLSARRRCHGLDLLAASSAQSDVRGGVTPTGM